MLAAAFRAIRLALRDPARAWLMMRMAAWVVVLSGVVKITSLPAALRLLSPKMKPKHDARADDLATAIDAVLGVNFLMLKQNCWKRAAVLHRYLSLRGVPTTIVFGVKNESGTLKGHAWLQCEGEPLLESSPPAYHITYSFPSSESFEGDLALMANSEVIASGRDD